ncbi:Conserved_hypothetical protein [Hexamita inflata]|uniref:Uncharacterized protein n=1 Tax=Hexamita inflata TaxID=28002 RepID=A0AA86V9T3_9EUKA|nr:Conserved hypothetical protein [Hexamita inflata]CAI9960463.1 Conserved hypothetical protein [Hexamita inflata]
MFQVDCLFDFHGTDQTVTPSMNEYSISINEPDRFLTSYEVKQSTRNMTVCELGLIEGELSLDRANKVINRLMRLYPFFSYGIRYDEEAQWMRYVQQPVREVSLQISKTLHSLQDIGDFIAAASHSLNSQKLSDWEVVNINIPEIATVKQALCVKVYHTLMDAVSVMQLLKKFNEMYQDIDCRFDDVEPVQLSNYRPVMSYDPELGIQSHRQESHAHGPRVKVTQITGQYNDTLGSALKQMDECNLRCRFYRSEDIARIPNVQYSFSLYAIHFAQIAAYAYFNKDLPRDQKFVGCGVDLRRENEMLKTDFDTILGQSATASGVYIQASLQTTLQQLADQMQRSHDSKDKSPEKFWEYALVNEMGPVQFDKGPSSCCLFVSNIGKMNLGSGPIVQMVGYASHTHVWDQPMLGIANTVNNGKIGSFVVDWDVKMFTENQQEQNSQIYLELNKLIIARGAEIVCVQDVVDIYERLFTLGE